MVYPSVDTLHRTYTLRRSIRREKEGASATGLDSVDQEPIGATEGRDYFPMKATTALVEDSRSNHGTSRKSRSTDTPNKKVSSADERERNNAHVRRSREKKRSLLNEMKEAYDRDEKRILFLEKQVKKLTEELERPPRSRIKKDKKSMSPPKRLTDQDEIPSWFGDPF